MNVVRVEKPCCVFIPILARDRLCLRQLTPFHSAPNLPTTTRTFVKGELSHTLESWLWQILSIQHGAYPKQLFLIL